MLPTAGRGSARAWVDRLGLGLATLCALHCLATALVLISFPALWLKLRYQAPQYLWVFEAERWIAAASLVLAGLALLLALRRFRARSARLLLLAGAAAVSAGLWWPPLAHSLWSVPAVSGGALLIALGHYLQLRGWRRCG
jgi:hypothetical protein